MYILLDLNCVAELCQVLAFWKEQGQCIVPPRANHMLRFSHESQTGVPSINVPIPLPTAAYIPISICVAPVHVPLFYNWM